MISATWWINSTIYIPEYSQYWYQHAVLNLITTRREFTLLEYSTTLSSIIASFCIIFDICYMMNQQYYIYSRILPVLISLLNLILEFINTLKHNLFYLISATWWINSNILLQLRIYSITVFYNTLKHNRIILYHIWWLVHGTWWILPVLISMLQYYIYSRILPVLISAICWILKWEFILLQYTTTLSSIIASFCIIFDICYMMNQQYYIYSRILPVLISTCCNQFNH